MSKHDITAHEKVLPKVFQLILYCHRVLNEVDFLLNAVETSMTQLVSKVNCGSFFTVIRYVIRSVTC